MWSLFMYVWIDYVFGWKKKSYLVLIGRYVYILNYWILMYDLKYNDNKRNIWNLMEVIFFYMMY